MPAAPLPPAFFPGSSQGADDAIAHALGIASGLARVHRGDVLDALAAELEARRSELIEVCADETNLTPEELTPEHARMVGTLRMFARLLRDTGDGWARPAHDPAPGVGVGAAQPLIGPGHSLRRALVPLPGVALVFGASNFPLAYGVCGGDTASALAAGLPVVVKEHPAHPRTGRALASACARAGAPVAYVLHEDPADLRVAQRLVQHAGVGAVGFTGSTQGGRAIMHLAAGRSDGVGGPIPAFCEMGAANVAIVERGALVARGMEIARAIGASILARVGQQCTRTGIVIVESDEVGEDAARAEAFVAELAAVLDAAPPRAMLSAGVAANYARRCLALRDGAAPALGLRTNRREPIAHELGPTHACPMLLEAPPHTGEAGALLRTHATHLGEEVFGPAAIVLHSADPLRAALAAPPMLALAVWTERPVAWPPTGAGGVGVGVGVGFGPRDHSDPRDAALALLAQRAGRVIRNGVTTGVRVAEAMVHGGPWPATNVPHTTAVGPMAIERWCRPVCWQG